MFKFLCVLLVFIKCISLVGRRSCSRKRSRSSDGLGFDVDDACDQTDLEDEESNKGCGDDGEEELFHAGHNFAASAWLLEGLILKGHVAVILNSGHFLFDFFLLIINSKDSL